jgi:F-type H+-transporting ATPase subunit gamma
MAINKELLLRIKGVKSTQKITKAMKMVAAAKLKKCKDKSENSKPYIKNLERLLANFTSNQSELAISGNALLSTNSSVKTRLIIVATSNRGLCGAFNSSIIKLAKKTIVESIAEGTEVKIYCIGKKGYDQLKIFYNDLIVQYCEIKAKHGAVYDDAQNITKNIIAMLDKGEFDTCHIIYNEFKSAMVQKLKNKQLIPLEKIHAETLDVSYESEPTEEILLAELLPHNLAIQIYHALIENEASEQGSRMTAMENATKNAGDMIQELTLKYNSSRQTSITKELIEIISGAEAV